MSTVAIAAGVGGGVGGVALGYLGLREFDKRTGLSDDVSLALLLIGLRKQIKEGNKKGFQISDLWYDVLARNPKKTFILYQDEAVSYQEVEDRSNQVANWFVSKGIGRGDTVALFMENRPEFIISWLGMTKIGVKAALINTSIKKKGLVHCIKIGDASAVLFGTELADSVNEVLSELVDLNIEVFGYGKEAVEFAPVVNMEIETAPIDPPGHEAREGIGMQDVFGYIYTSGTTGLPKAGVIMHQKMFSFGAGMARAYKIRATDIIYTCLPLFHSAGGGLGVMMAMYTGATIAIRQKFSASNFWSDCIKYKCTVVQYIGELCRYLILQERKPEERKHSVRIAVGNGLRPEIWAEFMNRFNILEVGEFYGATEGNLALVNHCHRKNKAAYGTVGRLGTLLKAASGAKVAKFNVESEELVRDRNGWCIECAPGEAGEVLIPIKDNDPATKFAGYHGAKEASEKKVLRDGFRKGDKFFRTGDLLSRDSRGYFRFVDRIGDTFRWRGENCSTNEIAEVLSTNPGVQEINIYGALVPGNEDGRAPMAAITPKDGDLSNLDLDGFLKMAKDNLPSYAVPLFIRIRPEMPVTATMKHQKAQLRKEGVDLDQVEDEVFWLNPDAKTYAKLTKADLQRIENQEVKI